MKITDEMIEVANRAVIEKRGYKYPGLFTDEELRIGRENMKVALEAAFAAVPAEPVTPAIRSGMQLIMNEHAPKGE